MPRAANILVRTPTEGSVAEAAAAAVERAGRETAAESHAGADEAPGIPQTAPHVSAAVITSRITAVVTGVCRCILRLVVGISRPHVARRVTGATVAAAAAGIVILRHRLWHINDPRHGTVHCPHARHVAHMM